MSSADTRGRGGASISWKTGDSAAKSPRGLRGSRSPRPSEYVTYYRHALRNLEQNRGAQNVRKNTYGRYGGAHPPRSAPLREVREVDVNKNPNKGKQPPKKAEIRMESDRKHGQRVYDAGNSVELWIFPDTPNPCISDGPYDPTLGSDERTMESEIKGREIANRAVEGSPAAAMGQWRSYTRMEARIHGEGSPIRPIYQPFYDAVESYRTRLGC